MTGIIILCRYNSSRLHGKIMKRINGKEILTYILERLAVLEEEYPIVVCTSIEKSDDPIVDYCKKNNIDYYRGDLDNVALRFLNCAQEHDFESAVRINGDNLFLDAGLIKYMIQLKENSKVEFVSNVKDRTFPKGMSVEIVSTAFYQKEFQNFEKSDLEHVMTYFYRLNEEHTRYVYNQSKEIGDLNLAIDTEEDFNNACRIIESMDKDHTQYDYNDIIRLFDKLKYDN